jgi:dCMP deaminase
MTLSWNNYFINLAQFVSLKSKDPSTKVGCVLIGPENQILSTGFNGFPMGVEDDILKVPARYERPLKYDYTNHAERNCIDLASRHGVSLRGATAFLNWTPIPCPNCSVGFIQAGIKRIVGPDRPFAGKGNWDSINKVSLPMLQEAGIELITIPEDQFQFIVPLSLDAL